jgi:Zn-dependent protease with chaperone function
VPLRDDFFARQDEAHQRTWRLGVLFALGLCATMASAWALIALGLYVVVGRDTWTDWRLVCGVIAAIGGLVGTVALAKYRQLSLHGGKVAALLGARKVQQRSPSASERKLLDLVSEMAIASATPMPGVYIIDEDVINAFAAGPDSQRSVIGVTRGVLERLDRDEAQGVVAHEFSHICHGDTVINARTAAAISGMRAIGRAGKWIGILIGALYLIVCDWLLRMNLFVAIGFCLLTIVFATFLVALWMLVWLVGAIGVLFGRLIQAATSRQREFLADAAAIQYTRNPHGLLRALVKVRDEGSAPIKSPSAGELNHFMFCNSLRTMFSSHPSIDERIRRIRAMGSDSMRRV